MKFPKNITDKFINPYIWQGFCWIDGGLGDQQPGEGLGWTMIEGKKIPNPTGVSKAVTNPLIKWTSDPGKYRIFLSPDSDYYIGDGSSDRSGVNPRYLCCCAGPDIQQLYKVIMEVAKVCKSQVWTLDAYLPDGLGTSQQEFRLWIRQGRIGSQNFEEPCFKILSGQMVPDFSKATDIAGW